MASSQQALITRVGDVEAGFLRGQNIQVEEVGVSVVIGEYMYCKANFYIDESRNHVGKRKLSRYIYIKWLHWFYIPIFIGSLFTPFHYIATFVLFAVNFLVFVNYFQHMYVNITTMWYVLKQPSVPDHKLKKNNMIYEIKLENYAVVYAASHRAGMGRIFRDRGTVQIQVFRHKAMRIMKHCVITSTLCFFCSLFMFVYCFVWGVVLVLQGDY